MAKVHIHSGQGAVGTGDLQLQNGAPMDATLRPVTDAANTASPLELSTGLVAVTSTLQIATNDTEYIDAEDGSGNNRFTVSRASGSQVVNVDFASNPTAGTDQVGAIRTYEDGANLSDSISFLRNGYVGIGTNAPDTALNIVGSNQCNLRVESTVAGGGIDLKDSTTTADNQVGIGAFGDDLCFRSGGAAAGNMRLLANGDLGIGTNSPATSVEIARSNSSLNDNIPTIRLTDLDTSSASNQITGQVEFYTSDGTPGPAGVTSYIRSNTESTSGLGALSFGTGQSGSATEKMRITSAGNVGIGTSSPDNVLDLGPAPSGRALTWDNYSNIFSSYSAGDLVLSNNFYGSTASDSYLTSLTATYGAAGIRVSATQGASTGGQIQFFANAAAAKTAGTPFTPTEICRVTPNGLTFNGDTAAANALDDYEEGTWTMGISFGGASVGVTYNFNTGRYTKIGRQVTAVGFLGLSSKGTSTGSATITGLPFTIASGTSNYSASNFAQMSVITYTGQMSGYGVVGNTTILLQTTNAGSLTSLSDSNFANNSEIMVTFTYFV